MRNLLAYSKVGVIDEKLTLRIKADNSGDIYLPVAGYSAEGTQDCDYRWLVSIDGGGETEYEGTGSNNGKIRVGYGLTPLSIHTVIIKPLVDEYGWLRAFGYKGTDIGSSLINIISDLSYKGYALSDKYSGDYYKAYQYYGCVNLVNTDEELLPDSLEIIGNYYRYYEYYGCVKLVKNADEKILKTVRAIGDYYRAYQYQNCTNIDRINMRAINWASVGSYYRLNQYSGTANDLKPMDIYIEGGIEEGGDWGLSNDNVKGVYVFKDLVSDYQTKLSGITSAKIKKNAEWDNYEYEFIEFIALADSSGEIRIPIGGLSTTMSQDCDYDWMISIDGGEETEYSGTGDDSYFSVGSGLTEGSEHRVVIKPKTIGWGWGRAFGYLSTGAQDYIKEIIHDSYKCFAVSRTDTGAHYKHATFVGCTKLINSYEKLPTSVETIGDYYMKECYAGCTGLKSAFWEVLHNGITVGEDYRHHEYTGCTSMEEHKGIAGYKGGTYPTNYKYEYLSGSGDDMKVYITRYEALESGLTNSLGLVDGKIDGVYCYVDDLYGFINNSYWSNVSNSKFQVYYYDYKPHITVDISKYTTLVGTYSMPDRDTDNEASYNIGGWNTWVRGVAPYSRNTTDVRVPGERNSTNTGTVFGRIYRVKWEGESGVAKDMGKSYDFSTGSGSQIDGNVKTFYVDYKGNVTYAKMRRSSSNKNYKEWAGRLNESMEAMTLTGWETAISASRDGRYVWGYNHKYYAPTKWGNATVDMGAIGGATYTNIDFSEDGMTAYLSEDFGTVTQYDLVAPRDLNNKVSSGKTLSIYGNWAFSKDFKYLYVYNGTLKVYEYTP